MPDDMPKNEAGHHLCLSWIDNPHNVDIAAQARAGEDVVGSCADRTDGFQIWIVIEGIMCRMPCDGELYVVRGASIAMINKRDMIELLDDAGQVIPQIKGLTQKNTMHCSGCLG